MDGTVLWDVDTQVDIIEQGGKLYFAGAEEARPAMRLLLEAARASRGVDDSRVTACLAAWRDAGVGFTTTEDAVASLG